MQVVGGGVVNHLHLRIVDERLVAAVAPPRTQRLGLLSARCVVTACDRNDVDIAQTPDRVDVMRADEAGADESHSDPIHERYLGRLEGPPCMTVEPRSSRRARKRAGLASSWFKMTILSARPRVAR